MTEDEQKALDRGDFPLMRGERDFPLPYDRVITLYHYGYSEPFGTYDQETKTLTITNDQAMGTMRKSFVEEDLANQQEAGMLIGSVITYQVPRKAWELSQRVRDIPERDR
jgi:hypothetical protein